MIWMESVRDALATASAPLPEIRGRLLAHQAGLTASRDIQLLLLLPLWPMAAGHKGGHEFVCATDVPKVQIDADALNNRRRKIHGPEYPSRHLCRTTPPLAHDRAAPTD